MTAAPRIARGPATGRFEKVAGLPSARAAAACAKARPHPRRLRTPAPRKHLYCIASPCAAAGGAARGPPACSWQLQQGACAAPLARCAPLSRFSASVIAFAPHLLSPGLLLRRGARAAPSPLRRSRLSWQAVAASPTRPLPPLFQGRSPQAGRPAACRLARPPSLKPRPGPARGGAAGRRAAVDRRPIILLDSFDTSRLHRHACARGPGALDRPPHAVCRAPRAAVVPRPERAPHFGGGAAAGIHASPSLLHSPRSDVAPPRFCRSPSPWSRRPGSPTSHLLVSPHDAPLTRGAPAPAATARELPAAPTQC